MCIKINTGYLWDNYGITSYDIPLDSQYRHPKVCNAQPFLSGTTCLCRMSFSSDILHLAGSCLSGNPSLSCIFSPIHSESLVGRECQILQHRAVFFHTQAILGPALLSVRLCRLLPLKLCTAYKAPGPDSLRYQPFRFACSGDRCTSEDEICIGIV